MRFFKILLATAVLGAVLVPNAMAFRFTDEARLTPTGVTGQPYNHRLTISAGCKLVTIKILDGQLPPGLSLVGGPSDETQDSWSIAGTPTTPGAFSFWIRGGSEWPECKGDSTEEYWTMRVVQGLAIQGAGLPVGEVGKPYPNQQLSATGGGTVTWSISSGALPAGLTLSSSGLVSGTPTESVQAKPVSIRATDGSRSTTRYYEVSVRAPLGIAPVVVPAIAQVNQPYKVGPLVATGGLGPYRWTQIEGTLPAGLTFNATTGTIEGIPTRGGIFPVKLRVTDSEQRIQDATLTLRIAAPVSITTKRLAALKVGRAYALQIRTSGGVAIVRKGVDTFNWKVTSGKLPLGLRLNTQTGKLVGKPRRSGVYAFTISVTDRFRNTDEAAFVVTVKK